MWLPREHWAQDNRSQGASLPGHAAPRARQLLEFDDRDEERREGGEACLEAIMTNSDAVVCHYCFAVIIKIANYYNGRFC